jgi:hypothetical protein
MRSRSLAEAGVMSKREWHSRSVAAIVFTNSPTRRDNETGRKISVETLAGLYTDVGFVACRRAIL